MSALRLVSVTQTDRDNGWLVPSAAARHELNPARFERPFSRPGNVSSVPTAAARHALNPVRFERPVTPPGSVSIVSVAAAQEIRKLTLSQICRPTPANQPIAVVARPEPERPLRPKFGRSPSTPSTSVHRRLRRRGLPSQQSVPVTNRSLDGRGRDGSSESSLPLVVILA